MGTDKMNRPPSNDPWSAGASLPLNNDGIFGPKTATRMRQFQSRNGLESDGVVGTMTRAKLVAQVASLS
jgi:peptidoglycan hydrolase-like protein with peptidoglycan-binding domain